MAKTLIKTDCGLWPIIEESFEAVLLAEPNSLQIEFANPTAAEWFATPLAELIGRNIEEVFNEASKHVVVARLRNTSVGDSNDEPLLAALRTPKSDVQIVSIRCCRIALEGRDLVGVLLHDVAVTRFDPLTALRDRDYLYSRLFKLLENSSHDRFAVLFIDLDNFKSVNDRHGHLIGDRVLFEAAKRLRRCFDQPDDVVRYGGDEFVVLLQPAADAKELANVAAQIRREIARPISVPDGEVSLSASVGIAVSSPQFSAPNDIIAAADRAMYAAKRERM